MHEYLYDQCIQFYGWVLFGLYADEWLRQHTNQKVLKYVFRGQINPVRFDQIVHTSTEKYTKRVYVYCMLSQHTIQSQVSITAYNTRLLIWQRVLYAGQHTIYVYTNGEYKVCSAM